MTLVFISYGSADWLGAPFGLLWVHSCSSLRLGSRASPHEVFLPGFLYWSGRCKTALPKGKGGSLRPSSGLGFGIHTVSIWPHSAGQSRSQGQSRFKGEIYSTSGWDEWHSHIAKELT